jgi:hypothetical protein
MPQAGHDETEHDHPQDCRRRYARDSYRLNEEVRRRYGRRRAPFKEAA